MKKVKIVITFGTRPEAIKMIPIYIELKKYDWIFDVFLAVSGQHSEMLDQVLNTYNVSPDVNFRVMQNNQNLSDLTGILLQKYDKLFATIKPNVVLVHGDTTTALTAAFEAFYHKIPVAHVEAGLRTHDINDPFPEEINRQLIGRFAFYHFSPTEEAVENLKAENTRGKIWVTGNTGIDALFLNLKMEYTDSLLNSIPDGKLIILTAHRRENLGKAMENIFEAVRFLSSAWPDYTFVYPVHPNPQIGKLAQAILGGLKNVYLIQPLDVIAFQHYLQKSKIILTDSGGIQEEAPSLGVPVLVLRDTTERPEGVCAGVLKLVGTETKQIIKEVNLLLNNPSYYATVANTKNPYGDGNASKKIVDILKQELGDN